MAFLGGCIETIETQIANWLVSGTSRRAAEDRMGSSSLLTVIKTKNRFTQPREQVCERQNILGESTNLQNQILE